MKFNLSSMTFQRTKWVNWGSFDGPYHEQLLYLGGYAVIPKPSTHWLRVVSLPLSFLITDGIQIDLHIIGSFRVIF